MNITEGNHDDVRERAYQLWLEAGEPEGREQEFWYQAERELAEGGEIDRSAKRDGIDKPPLMSAAGPH